MTIPGKSACMFAACISTFGLAQFSFAQEVADNDMNGDQVVDEVTGEPDAGGAGKVTVQSGLGGNDTSVIVGTTVNGKFGSALTSQWDVDQDGFNDLLIAAPKEGAGVVYFYYGPFLTSNTNFLSTNDADVILEPIDIDIYKFGDDVAGVPDIEGDGIVDILVRGLFLDSNNVEQSRTFIYSGSTWEILLTLDNGLGFNPWEFIAEYNSSDYFTEQQLADVLRAYYINGQGVAGGEEGGGENSNLVVCECNADISSPDAGVPDGVVDISDMLLIFDQWGCTGTCSADINGDGVVDTSDLLIIIDQWGACDSDDDGMPDYWEALYGFDECDSVDSSQDPDVDGLSNLDEYLNGTDPNNSDSDDDGVSDGAEVIGGSDPNDGSDNGVGPNSDNVLYVKIQFGDQSCHASERWNMEFGGIMYELQFTENCVYDPDYDCLVWWCEDNLPKTFGPIAIERGQSYKIRMKWVNSVYQAADYDWRCNVLVCEADGSNPQTLVDYYPNGAGYEDDEYKLAEPIEGVFLVDPSGTIDALELLGSIWTEPNNNPTGGEEFFATLYAYAGDLKVYRPQNPPITVRQVPDEIEHQSDNPSVLAGAGIRFNGDNDDGDQYPDNWDTSVDGEDDLIRIMVDGQALASSDLELVLHSNNTMDIKLWNAETKDTELEFDVDSNATVIRKQLYYIECVNPNFTDTTIKLGIQVIGSTNISVLDTILLHRFESVVIVLGGETQEPADPIFDPDGDGHGTFQMAIDLYQEGYNVFMYNEDNVDNDSDPMGSGLVYENLEEWIPGHSISEVAVMGYSHGGGSTHDLCWRLTNILNNQPGISFTIPFTSYVDAVAQPLALQEHRYPPGSSFLLNQYQEGVWEEDWGLDGGPVIADPANGEYVSPPPTGLNVELLYPGIFHNEIDDLPSVLNLIKSELRSRIIR